MQQVRTTKYSTAVTHALQSLGHATNAEIIALIRREYPEVSETTIHRVTARMAEHGDIAFAPRDDHGAIRYDNNITAHDHFICTGCGGLRDIDVAEEIMPTIVSALGGCDVSGRLEIKGRCSTCRKKEN